MSFSCKIRSRSTHRRVHILSTVIMEHIPPKDKISYLWQCLYETMSDPQTHTLKKGKGDTLLLSCMDFGKETELPWTGSRNFNPRTSTKTKGQQRLIKPNRKIYFPAGSQTQFLTPQAFTVFRAGGVDKFCSLTKMSRQP